MQVKRADLTPAPSPGGEGIRLKRALSVNEIRNYKPVELNFEGKWKDAIGTPELTGTWLIWGNSANGKTRFALQLAKYLTEFRRVAYNSLEEGLSKSMKEAILAVGIERNFLLLDKEPVDMLKARLRKRKSPDVVFIDSLQYTGMSYVEYKRLRDEFPAKLFIFISHAEGNEPKGNVGKSIKYDAFVKIPVIGYAAYPQSRYGGGEKLVIWQWGYEKFA